MDLNSPFIKWLEEKTLVLGTKLGPMKVNPDFETEMRNIFPELMLSETPKLRAAKKDEEEEKEGDGGEGGVDDDVYDAEAYVSIFFFANCWFVARVGDFFKIPYLFLDILLFWLLNVVALLSVVVITCPNQS